jgi:hypothetical protein
MSAAYHQVTGAATDAWFPCLEAFEPTAQPRPPAVVAENLFLADREFLSLKVSTSGSTLEALGKWLMQLVAILIVVQLLVHHEVVPKRILLGLFIIGFGYWLTVLELRRKARADFGL